MLTYSQVNEIIGIATFERKSPIITPRSLNMEWRGGIEPRHGLGHLQTVFDDEADRALFEGGVVQKVQPYQPYGLNPGGLAILISGTLFFGSISGRWMYVSKLFEGLRPDLTLGWGVQAFEWLIIQNGVDRPIIWDGHDPAFQSKPEELEMPIGSMMAFIHHQVAVASSDGTDKIAVSDRWRQSESENLWHFTGTPTWADGGVFGLHINMGKLMNMCPMTQIKQTPNGQGDLLLIGSNGAQTLNLQVPVAERINSQIQDTAMVGQGSASYLGAIPHKAGIWYIGHDGLHEFKHGQNDFYRSDADIHESADIQYYWDNSNSLMRPVQPLGQYNNKILIGLYPEMGRNDFGFHRYHRAWAAVDLSEKWREGVKLPKRWNGLQCGIRPVEWANLIINRIERTYCMSFDADGVNRVYEFTNHLTYDLIEGEPKPIVSFFDTPPLVGQKGVQLVVKRPAKVKIDYEAAVGNVAIDLDVRGENETCWSTWGGFCARPTSDVCEHPCAITPEHRGSKPIGDPKPIPCFSPPPTSLRSRVRMTGRARIQNMIFGLDVAKDVSPDGFSHEIFLDSCGSCSDAPRASAQCCEELGIYSIQP